MSHDGSAKDAAHLWRLAAVFAAGVVLFLVLQRLLVPATFGQYGHYRGAALGEIRARAVTYAGRKACADCHDDMAGLLKAGHHAKVGCESCHGAHAAHAADPDKVAAVKPDARVLCVRCHAALASRPAKFPQVNVAEHAGTETCISCHNPHDPLGEAPGKPATPAASPAAAAAVPSPAPAPEKRS